MLEPVAQSPPAFLFSRIDVESSTRRGRRGLVRFAARRRGGRADSMA
jgi:hypothetical protein